MDGIAFVPPTTSHEVLRAQLTGSFSLADGSELWRALHSAPAATRCEVDLRQVVRLDGGCAALLQAWAMQRQQHGGTVEFVGASADVARVLQLYRCRDDASCERTPPQSSLLQDVGDATVEIGRATRAIFAFAGDLATGLVQAVRRPRTVHLSSLGRLVEAAGADAVPIVALVNFLVGVVLGLQGAIQLHRFGGDPFLANLVGLSVVRELGPLMTAILVAGRSGAAYAAELGTMTVSEEVDALRTLGQDPQRFLVFPRVLALVLVVPVLTAIGDLLGTLGGLAIAVGYLDQPPIVYVQNLQRAVTALDVGTGLIKSVFFAVAIGLIACQRGLATRGGAVGVGRSTTSAVVVVLFSLVAIDAVFTWLFSVLDW
jgi:phospholipid/cholesterol/gamma-HCH transport system permease protein